MRMLEMTETSITLELQDGATITLTEEPESQGHDYKESALDIEVNNDDDEGATYLNPRNVSVSTRRNMYRLSDLLEAPAELRFTDPL